MLTHNPSNSSLRYTQTLSVGRPQQQLTQAHIYTLSMEASTQAHIHTNPEREGLQQHLPQAHIYLSVEASSNSSLRHIHIYTQTLSVEASAHSGTHRHINKMYITHIYIIIQTYTNNPERGGAPATAHSGTHKHINNPECGEIPRVQTYSSVVASSNAVQCELHAGKYTVNKGSLSDCSLLIYTSLTLLGMSMQWR